MSEIAEQFEKVLEQERQFAIKADVDGLGAIQDEKRALLDQLNASGLSRSETERLHKLALANVQLIRHLVACLKGLCAPAGPTYNAGGDRPSSAPSRSWGRL